MDQSVRAVLPRRLARAVAAFVLLLLCGPFQFTGAAADHATELYRSEQYDFFFFYDASDWVVQDQFSEPGAEFVRFSDGTIVVDYWLFDAPDMTAGDCLKAMLDRLAAEPGIVAIESLESPPGLPQIQAFGDSAFTRLIVTLDPSDPRGKLASSERCERLAPGAPLLYTSINIPAREFNAGRNFDRSLIELTPWIKGYRPDYETYVPLADLIDANGVVVGTLEANPVCADFDRIYGIARNLSPSDSLIVDPFGFFAVTLPDEQVEPVNIDWLYPTASPNTEFVLQPGEVGLFKLAVGLSSGGFELWYSHGEGSQVFLGRGAGPAGVAHQFSSTWRVSGSCRWRHTTDAWGNRTTGVAAGGTTPRTPTHLRRK
jgi:hypothetical protein